MSGGGFWGCPGDVLGVEGGCREGVGGLLGNALGVLGHPGYYTGPILSTSARANVLLILVLALGLSQALVLVLLYEFKHVTAKMDSKTIKSKTYICNTMELETLAVFHWSPSRFSIAPPWFAGAEDGAFFFGGGFEFPRRLQLIRVS